ncbi:hypothetical protein MLD38_026250 [Melastoma candidum]|uniref:Uncharacterized protein n=1 Tax=Melastoma candidum TaxID=119954 RepID=A0ACB9P0U6_9MYRT|nr:hypothetical protein MLD38_026250 [Melastoma candidum]
MISISNYGDITFFHLHEGADTGGGEQICGWRYGALLRRDLQDPQCTKTKHLRLPRRTTCPCRGRISRSFPDQSSPVDAAPSRGRNGHFPQ